MKKTLFATLLALVLSVSCMTGTVFAAETNSDVDAVTSVSSLTVTPIGSFGGYGHRVTGTASGSFYCKRSKWCKWKCRNHFKK